MCLCEQEVLVDFNLVVAQVDCQTAKCFGYTVLDLLNIGYILKIEAMRLPSQSELIYVNVIANST